MTRLLAEALEASYDTRTKRAIAEAFELSIADADDGLVNVKNVSKADPSVYTVAVVDGEAASCSCPDHEHNDHRCKHMRKVDRTDAVMLALSRDGTDDVDDTATERPDDCDCTEAADDETPCFACYTAGFESPRTAVTSH
jgi:hypothetical protein